ncbi:MAG TPA: phage tail protein [Chloroflexi bacterium]|nr:phage tail protein [Chloroflexota bacterium]HHW86474.1 phage tail sheath family protein [Chloroflexota bacterium]
MPVTLSYPGVYIEEAPSGVRTIVGVATSITAFVGRALRGPVNQPVRVQSFAEFERIFGGLWSGSGLSYAVQHFFLNGGGDALIVRVVHTGDNTAANNAVAATGATGGLDVVAANAGAWGNRIRIVVDHATRDPADTNLFNLTVQEMDGVGSNANVIASESFRNVSVTPTATRFVQTVLAAESTYLRATTVPNTRPGAATVFLTGGQDGIAPTAGEVQGVPTNKTGIYALEDADLFNLLCIPPVTPDGDTDPAVYTAALAYCKTRRAMLLVDPRTSWANPTAVESDANNSAGFIAPLRDENAILYFPRVRMADPLQENRLASFVPCGVMAGVIARTDAQRGVWKAPAGQDATLVGVRELTYKMTDGENGRINPLGVNALRAFPVTGNVGWGARTLEGADRLASEWKYIPVRRLALFIEESLFRGTQWVVFEPNDEPLWAQIRLNVGAFMQDLFRQGAFQGSSPREAFFVRCDRTTTTQSDIDRGVVNIHVGFAPLKPAEFVVIRIQQIAGQSAGA